MSEEAIVTILVSALVGSVIGGGSTILVIRLALTESLRKTFATIEATDTIESDIDNLGKRVNQVEIFAHGASDAAADAVARTRELERMQQEQWNRISDHIIRPIEIIGEKLERITSAQSELAGTQRAQQETMKALAATIDRLEREQRHPKPGV